MGLSARAYTQGLNVRKGSINPLSHVPTLSLQGQSKSMDLGGLNWQLLKSPPSHAKGDDGGGGGDQSKVEQTKHLLMSFRPVRVLAEDRRGGEHEGRRKRQGLAERQAIMRWSTRVLSRTCCRFSAVEFAWLPNFPFSLSEIRTWCQLTAGGILAGGFSWPFYID